MLFPSQVGQRLCPHGPVQKKQIKALLLFSKRHPSAFLNPAIFQLSRAKKKAMRRRQRKEPLLFSAGKGDAVVHSEVENR